MRPVHTVKEMQTVDEEALGSVSHDTLVQRAGTAVAAAALGLLGGAYGRRVVVVAGPGSNGADGRVAAARLAARGVRVTVLDAKDAPTRLTSPVAIDLVIDAAYGTGFHGTYNAPEVPAGVRVLAVDIPSGVDGNTGEACGEPLRADLTVTFAALKPGVLQGAGADLAGRVHVADIGLDVRRATIWVVEDCDVPRLLPSRARDTNKWKSALSVVGGSPGMVGAAFLASRAAYRAGAGMVRLVVPGENPGDLPVSEAVALAAPAEQWAPVVLATASRCRALVLGPGLGQALDTGEQIRAVLAESPVPVVLDADGLVALAQGPRGVDGLPASVREAEDVAAGRAVILTPHDGEFATLTGSPPPADRIAATRRLAASTGAVVLLKGPTTVVAAPDGRVLLALAGSARLATAGTGDVLSGVIGAFLARGVPPFEAAGLAAHVHGRAASLGIREGLVAGDLVELVATYLSECRDA
jgi:NAD(P)H-hydrate epimerase